MSERLGHVPIIDDNPGRGECAEKRRFPHSQVPETTSRAQNPPFSLAEPLVVQAAIKTGADRIATFTKDLIIIKTLIEVGRAFLPDQVRQECLTYDLACPD